MSEKSHQNALPEHHQLHWYRIQRVLGQGAFGITYLAQDINLERLVAIKEYMPGQMATRAGDLSIQPQSDEHREDFHWGLRRFVDEARTLTRFEHPNLVRVHNVFELHGTAYMVMNYELGESLQQVLKRGKTLDERSLIAILIPLLKGLELIHGKGFVHRDIKPGNIFIRNDGSPVLLDFGSARQTRGHADPQTLTTLVSPGYAPIEQYTSKSNRQGPWTDIYGLAATLYRAIVGSPPSSATDRSALLHEGMKDDLQQLSSLTAGQYSERFLAAIDHGLAFKVEDRPQSIAAWRAEFAFNEAEIDTQPDVMAVEPDVMTDPIPSRLDAATQAVPGTVRTRSLDREARTEPVDRVPPIAKTEPIAPAAGRSGRQRAVLIGVAVVIVLGVGLFLKSNDEEPGVSPDAPPSPAPTTATVEAAPTPDTEPAVQQDGQSAQITELLAQAEADIAALRLTSPKGENAYERYNDVLALDAGNPAAMDGLRGISQRYVDLAYGAINKGLLDDAAIYLLRAGRIEPPAQGLPAAKAALAKRFADARLAGAGKPPKSARLKATRIKDAISNTSGVPVEERINPSERVKDALGEH
jgi:serine/threonine protein kinase